ncbi:hypothetical protein Ciccas_001986 [Cichlidogyrus casuarinus]|uniref:Acyl-CoA-binding domain-containing protein 6 n=1 Tax=Cichlidogyrus casuarinus TaxID=1844966 RepID=A0ABD2QJI5_9PLAT
MDIEAEYQTAVTWVQDNNKSLTESELLYFYARFKQATATRLDRACFSSQRRPNGESIFTVLNLVSFRDAWDSVKGKSKEDSKKEYVQKYREVKNKGVETASTVESAKRVSTMRLLGEEDTFGYDPTLETCIIPFARDGQLAPIEQLLEAGKVQAKSMFMTRDQHGLTALHWAVDRGHISVVRFLLEKCPCDWFDVNDPDSDGQTPLHYCAMSGNVELCKYLCSKGASKAAKDAEGLTPRDVAEDSISTTARGVLMAPPPFVNRLYLAWRRRTIEVFHTSSPGRRLNIIVAVGPNNGIGFKGHLPWLIKQDMAHFRKITLKPSSQVPQAQNVAIMGRNTWESIPERFRPLKNRINCVISSTLSLGHLPQVKVYASFAKCLEEMYALQEAGEAGEIFVIGGQRMYEEAMQRKDRPVRIFCTHVKKEIEADCFFPAVDWTALKKVPDPDVEQGDQQDEQGTHFEFCIYDLC